MKDVLKTFWEYVIPRKDEIIALINVVCNLNVVARTTDMTQLCIGCKLKEYFDLYVCVLSETEKSQRVADLCKALTQYVKRLRVFHLLVLKVSL